MSASTDISPARLPRGQACVLCQRRKVKCDRNFPCSNCTKANVECVASAPPPPRKRRRPKVELQNRLARCEQLLAEYANANAKLERPESDASSDIPHPSLTPQPGPRDLNWEPTGKLIVEDGGTRFTDGFLWTKVYEELRAMRELTDMDDLGGDSQEGSPSQVTPDYNEYLLFGNGLSPEIDVEKLRPSPGQVFSLWQVYLDRVNPLTKLIHAPTLQPYLVEATSGSQNLPKNVEALLFSIFSMATISLTEGECSSILGSSKNAALGRFSAGVRITLLRVEFLKSHDLTTLQALVLHLISLQSRPKSHPTWVLNGVCIRIAQKMGLHRDGELLGLSPFETEMRRRIWWQIVMLDALSAMASGLSPTLLPRVGDCKMIKNLNDADLLPNATAYFEDRRGPTEMIVCLIMYKMGEFLIRWPNLHAIVLSSEISAVGSGTHFQDQSAEFKKLTETIETSLDDIMEKYSDPSAGPIHELAIQMKLAVCNKIQHMLRQAHDQPEWGVEVNTPKDNLFKLAITAVEHSVRLYQSVPSTGFLWFMRMHFQHDIFLFMVAQLCLRTSGTLVEKAWEQIPLVYEYHPDLFYAAPEYNLTLANFVLKAWGLRQAVLSASHGNYASPPEYIQKLQGIFPGGNKPSDEAFRMPPEMPFDMPFDVPFDVPPGMPFGMPPQPGDPILPPGGHNPTMPWDHEFSMSLNAALPDWNMPDMPGREG
ncbi:fungal-specific transcription factor domain-containing protein [Ilyonectria sp. MPI-CAGE-AT-0026]|nr:fungal-specific transcription factor domain-containing protein [Ilyonectria sp. MPI-CAGE-AT-0026]